jgi:HPt (histidine-containing phosphotransfer) domain-containing protein
MVGQMKVNQINNISYLSNLEKMGKIKKAKSEQQTDRLEISKEAKALAKSSANLSAERVAEINKRIEENFYDQKEVLDIVAKRILKSPNFKEFLSNKDSS